MSGFFRGHKRRGSYDLFSSYNHFLPGWGGLLVLGLLFALGTMIGGYFLRWLESFSQTFADEYGLLLCYPITFFPAMIYASTMSRLNEHRICSTPVDNNPEGWKNTLLLALGCSVATIATAYITEPITEFLPEMPQEWKDAMDRILHNMPFWATLVSVSIFAPLFEELLCRGFILRGLLQKTSPAIAICISALFFALIHGNPWQAIPAFILGLLFGEVYYRTRSLKLTMLMHCANNTVAACLSKVPEFKEANTFMDVLSPWAYWSIFAACILILASALVILRNAQQHQDCPAYRHL